MSSILAPFLLLTLHLEVSWVHNVEQNRTLPTFFLTFKAFIEQNCHAAEKNINNTHTYIYIIFQLCLIRV